jgi:hypothetical protein
MMGLINVWIWFQAKINTCNKAERKVWTWKVLVGSLLAFSVIGTIDYVHYIFHSPLSDFLALPNIFYYFSDFTSFKLKWLLSK